VFAVAPATNSKGRLDDAGQQVASVSRLPISRREARKAGIAAEENGSKGNRPKLQPAKAAGKGS
jgi:hypothetical protein